MVKKEEKISYTLARESDGGVQITFDIPFGLVEEAKEETYKEHQKSTEVPGFRKGKAPLEEVKKKIPEASVIEHALGHLLPKAMSEAVIKEKLNLALYPKFELIKAKENEDWQVRAVSCEILPFELGDYKKVISQAGKSKEIWTPGKGDPKEKKEPSREEKEQVAIQVLLESVKVVIPKLLIVEEVNSRLASLLERIEKLGLNLDSYLASVRKTPDSLRSEYELQAKNSISLDFILTKVAQEQKIEIKDAEVDSAIEAAASDAKIKERLNTPEQRRVIKGVLARRAALDSLCALI